jgi:hypothetical protein
MICPNKSHPDWVKLVNKIGINEAYREFIANDYTIPNPSNYKESFNGINATLKIVDGIESIQRTKFTKDKADGFYNDLTKKGVPKNQIDLLRDYISKNNITEISKPDLITNILSELGYTVEINKQRTRSYKHLTVSGGSKYSENEIRTPAIRPSITGHAAFSTDNGIGWFRSDEIGTINKIGEKIPDGAGGLVQRTVEKGSKTRRVLEVQSDLFQKGRNEKDLIGEIDQNIIELPEDERYDAFLQNEENEINRPKTINSKENKFLQVLNKDNNWITFFIKSIIQDSARKGYEKVLFPVGETAAKIEGHQTIEGFINQQQVRIDKLEKELNRKPIHKENGFWAYDIEAGQFKTEKEVQDIIDENKPRIIKEINQLKAEIERVRREGIDSLNPIRKFYEDTIANILKKNYKTEIFTDEYNNKWNEVTITPEQRTDTIYYQLPQTFETKKEISRQIPNETKYHENKFQVRDKHGKYKRYANTQNNLIVLSKRVQEINERLLAGPYKAVVGRQAWNGEIKLIIQVVPKDSYRIESNKDKVNGELNSKLKQWLSKLGIQVKYFDTLSKEFSNDPVAVSDFLNKVIKVSQGKEDSRTLPEETMHFATELLGAGNPNIQRLSELIVNTELYKQVKEQYKDVYTTERQFINEAIAKAGAEVLINHKEKSFTQEIVDSIKKMWNDFLQFFKGADVNAYQAEIDYILGKVASDIVNQSIEKYDINNLPEGEMFRLSQDYKSEQDVLKAAINNTFNRMRNLMAKGSEEVGEQQKELYNKLKRQLEKEQYRLGLYSFVASARVEGRRITQEFEALSDNDDPNTIVRTLNKISKFLQSYKPILEDINITLEQENVDANIISKVKETIGHVDRLQKSYLETAKPVVSKFLSPYAEKSDGTSVDLKTALDFLDKDITFTQRWLDAAAEVQDDVIKITDKLVKEYRETERLESLKDQKEIVQAKLDLEKAGVPDAKWIYERNKKGTVTGYFIRKHNWGEYKAKEEQFFDDISKKFGLQKGEKPRIGTSERREWALAIADWYNKNTVVKEGVKDIIEKRRKEIFDKPISKQQATLEWNEWQAKNIGYAYDSKSGDIMNEYYKGELVEPSDDYVSEEWADMYNKDGSVKGDERSIAKDKYYKFILAKKEAKDSKLPEKMRPDLYLAPQQRKDTIERLKTSENIKKFVEDEFKDRFIRNEDDIDFGLKVTDENGIPLSFIPLYYTRKLKDTRDLSLDLTTAMVSYSHTANNYNSMNKIIDLLELESDVLRERKVGTGQFALLSSFSLGEPVVKKGEATYAYQRFQDYLKMVVYGEQKLDEGTLFGTKFDKAKTIDAFGKYVSMNGLALNVYSGISNITYGSAMIRMEAIANEYFTNKDLLYADKTYAENTAGMLGDVGSRQAQNKLSLFMETMNVLQDFEENIREIDGERKTKFGQLANTSSLYFINKAGEHWMQTRTSLALANTVKLKDSEGNIKNLFDAFSVVDSKLELQNGLTIVPDGRTFKDSDSGRPFTEKELIRIINKQNFVNKRLHGIYNRVDKSAIQKYALGRLAIMFRKFMKPGWNRRFANLQYNYEGETYTEGYYTTMAKFMWQILKDLKNLQFTLGAKWGQLEEYEKKNMYRMLTELGYFIASYTLIAVATSLKGDDDDDWYLNMMAYQANRLYSELRFYSEPNEFFKIMGSPAAGIDQAQKITNFIKFWNWTEEIESGRYKGYTKFEKGLIDVVPFASTANKFLSPDEQVKYFSK